MSNRSVPGRVISSRRASEVAREASSRIASVLHQAIAKGGTASIALSGGNTPRDAYALLAREPEIDWSKVHVFWVDERAVPPDDDRSNYRWAKAELLERAPIVPEHVHRMLAESDDLPSAAQEYQQTIRQHVELDADGVPSFDVVVLGVGDDGHTASLFPGEATVSVTDRLVAPVPASGAREARLTLTPPVLEHARNVFVLAIGSGKRLALERAWATEGSLHETPARIIRGCRGSVTWLIDSAAGDPVGRAGN
jgi:6-phosphogluconolactonase